MIKQQHNESRREAAVQMHLDGSSVDKIAQEYGVKSDTVKTWIREYLKKGDGPLQEDKNFKLFPDTACYGKPSPDSMKESARDLVEAAPPVDPTVAVCMVVESSSLQSEDSTSAIVSTTKEVADKYSAGEPCINSPLAIGGVKPVRSGKYFMPASIDDLMLAFRTGLISSGSLISACSGVTDETHQTVVLGTRDFKIDGVDAAALELVLSGDEVSRLKGYDICLLNSPIPLSRLVRVHLSRSQEAPESFVKRFMFPDSALALPLVSNMRDCLPQNDKASSALKTQVIELINNSQDASLKDVSQRSFDRFDRMLGALALMRSAGYYFTFSHSVFIETMPAIADVMRIIIENLAPAGLWQKRDSAGQH